MSFLDYQKYQTMAKVEDLIKRVTDAQLRVDLEREVRALKRETKFGLVFEDHIPENALLFGASIRVGQRVAIRGRRSDDTYVVEAMLDGGKNCRIRLENELLADSTKHLGRKAKDVTNSELVTVEQLVAVKHFGEPIYPTLSPVAQITRDPEKPYHTLINADNFHALQLLLYCYEAQVDVIYIDPPYNTGAKDWKYNNSYVDLSDQWRHSKWLSFMRRRLLLARRLLKPRTGALIVTIDEHEVHHLGMLLEKVFPDHYRQMVTIVVNPKGVTQGRFSRVEEYALFCFAKDAGVVGRGDDLLTPEAEDEAENDTPRWKGLLRSGTNARREDRKGLFFPVLVDPERGAVLGAGEPLPYDQQPDFDTLVDGLVPVWPVRTDGSLGNWGVGPVTLRQLIGKGFVALGGYDPKRRTYGISYLSKKLQNQVAAGVLRVISFDEVKNIVDVRYSDVAERQIKSVWHRTSHDAGAYGSDLLKTILGGARAFSFPKSLYAVKDALSAVARDNPDALILDFFAGSGTTLHATCLLNAELGGRRRCILVTNNEVDEKQAKTLNAAGYWPGDPEFEQYGISHSVTWPRCKYVVNGKRDDGTELPGTYLNGREFKEGFAENVEYFNLTFLDPHHLAKGQAFECILPVLWLMSGAKGMRETGRGSRKWFVAEHSPYAVLIDENYFDGFRHELAKRPDIKNVFLVTDSDESFRDMVAELPGSPLALMLYKSYLENFKINIERQF
jgi:adenine-specific DNA-methyltransferase